MPHFDEFYEKDFDNAKIACEFNPKARVVVEKLKAKNISIILTTNPIFPKIATLKRISWAGLNANDFEFITTYENSSFCKPNLEYYKSIVEKFNIDPSTCLMVGNDVDEDMVAENIGMKVFLLTDCIINKNNSNIFKYPHGNFDDLLNYLNN